MKMRKGSDYIGFTLDGVHSSEFGVLRVSGGSRYSTNLLPAATDRFETTPGRDGSYYFGTTYNGQSITLNIAFQGMTEFQKTRFSELLGQKKIMKLIFDEEPYKYYLGKIAGEPRYDFIPFDNGYGLRTYNGEGTITFTAHQPYARSVYKDYAEYERLQIWNREEWRLASGLIRLQDLGFDIIDSNTIKLYNPGVKETPLKLSFTLPCALSEARIEGVGAITLEPMTAKGTDTHILIDSATHQIRGYSIVSGEKVFSGFLYNEFISGGDFLKLPKTDATGATLVLVGARTTELEYDYLYY